MGSRLLKVTKCGECPFAVTFMEHRSIGVRCKMADRAFHRVNGAAVYPQEIPDWCPLPKDPDHA